MDTLIGYGVDHGDGVMRSAPCSWTVGHEAQNRETACHFIDVASGLRSLSARKGSAKLTEFWASACDNDKLSNTEWSFRSNAKDDSVLVSVR